MKMRTTKARRRWPCLAGCQRPCVPHRPQGPYTPHALAMARWRDHNAHPGDSFRWSRRMRYLVLHSDLFVVPTLEEITTSIRELLVEGLSLAPAPFAPLSPYIPQHLRDAADVEDHPDFAIVQAWDEFSMTRRLEQALGMVPGSGRFEGDRFVGTLKDALDSVTIKGSIEP